MKILVKFLLIFVLFFTSINISFAQIIGTVVGTGSTGCNFTSGNSHLAGNDYVLLQEGFEASGSNTTVLINTMQCQTGQTITYNSTSNPSPAPSFQQKRDIKLRQKR